MPLSFIPQSVTLKFDYMNGRDSDPCGVEVLGRLSGQGDDWHVSQALALHLTPEEMARLFALIQDAAQRTLRQIASLLDEPVVKPKQSDDQLIAGRLPISSSIFDPNGPERLTY